MVGRNGITTGFSDFDIIIDIDEPFPVEYLSLNATPQNDHIVVDWTTSSELNNKGFVVERSTSPDEGFANIGWVDGSGTTQERSEYTLPDEEVVFNQQYYYRLRQMDFDGKATMSQVVSAMLSANGELGFTVYPNPTRDVMQLNYVLGDNCCDIELKLFDAVGKLVNTWELTADAPNGSYELDMKPFASGVYTLQFSAKQFTESMKVVKAD